MNSKQLREYVVLDIEASGPSTNRLALADVQVHSPPPPRRLVAATINSIGRQQRLSEHHRKGELFSHEVLDQSAPPQGAVWEIAGCTSFEELLICVSILTGCQVVRLWEERPHLECQDSSGPPAACGGHRAGVRPPLSPTGVSGDGQSPGERPLAAGRHSGKHSSHSVPLDLTDVLECILLS